MGYRYIGVKRSLQMLSPNVSFGVFCGRWCFPQQGVCLQSFPLPLAESQVRSNRLRLWSDGDAMSKERRMLTKHPFLIRALHWIKWAESIYLRTDCKATFFFPNSEAALALCITSGHLQCSTHTCWGKVCSLFLSSLEQIRGWMWFVIEFLAIFFKQDIVAFLPKHAFLF